MEKEVRVRVQAKSTQVREQCLRCGAPRGNALRQTEENLSAPPWDFELAEKFRNDREVALAALQSRFVAEQRAEEAKAAELAGDWQGRYAAYRRTPAWQKKRSLVMRRANGVCEGCAEAPAEVVHHLSYEHMGDELLFELVALCHPCHRRAHPEHQEEWTVYDYLPCEDCRYYGDAYCTQFEQMSFEALSAGGPCGLTASGFEGLK